MSVGFHPGRLHEAIPEIKGLLADLPEGFSAGAAGRSSRRARRAAASSGASVCLGIAAGLVNFCLLRDMWSSSRTRRPSSLASRWTSTGHWSPPASLIGNRLLIHAGKSASMMRAMGWGGSLPLGAIVGSVLLVSARLEPGRADRRDHPSCGDVRWLFSDPVLLEQPVPAPGQRGIFHPVLDL